MPSPALWKLCALARASLSRHQRLNSPANTWENRGVWRVYRIWNGTYIDKNATQWVICTKVDCVTTLIYSDNQNNYWVLIYCRNDLPAEMNYTRVQWITHKPQHLQHLTRFALKRALENLYTSRKPLWLYFTSAMPLHKFLIRNFLHCIVLHPLENKWLQNEFFSRQLYRRITFPKL